MDNKERTDILIVDDKPENLLALESLLAGPEVNVVKASSGNEALARVLASDYAVVLLDVQMPDMNGFETAELMRGSKRTRHIPIIFVTALSKESSYVFKGYESGAVDYLFKPVEPSILLSKVNIFCELHRHKMTIRRQVEEIADKNKALVHQLAEIKTLRGLLPICIHCKKIKNDDGYWQALEVYVRAHSQAEFSHCICTDCVKRFYPDHFS